MAFNSFLYFFHFFFFFIIFSEAANSSDSVILHSNSNLQSPNRNFTLGFFNPNPQFPNSYLGIWYSSIPGPVYVWVANRQSPLKSLTSASLLLSAGKLAVKDSDTIVYVSDNSPPASELHLLDSGNLVLLSRAGDVLWQSFHHPTDTWLPELNLTSEISLTSWRSLTDPSPGRFSLRIRPPVYGEVELVSSNGLPYWTTGNWSGTTFPTIPQMTIPYLYRFYFNDAFTRNASFGFTETALDGFRPLTRFYLNPSGQLRQYTWSAQTEVWNTFWVEPDNPCRANGLCGDMGVCNGLSAGLCGCLDGFDPVDRPGWDDGDFSSGCKRRSLCGAEDVFEGVGVAVFDDSGGSVQTALFHEGDRKVCEKECLGNCSCVGFYYNDLTSYCKTLFGSLSNIRNSSSDTSVDGNEVLYIRLGGDGSGRSRGKKISVALLIVIVVISGVALFVLVVVILTLLLLRMRVIRKRREEEETILSVTNLRVFSYKELHSATRGFSEKLGHGGFGTVFRGVLSDASPVAVKRLERPGGAEREFRAEVCTIGNIQHVNLVRLRGFCSEESHRLLVYDYMPNGALSAYLKRVCEVLSWEVRFRVAIGTAKAIAYLHEGCRDCIIHCDIKPENILLDCDYIAKVSDFGLAKLVGRDFSRVLATMRGTWGYVAPEWISGVAITNKADVYSYGMTVLELISGRRNVEAPPDGGGGEEKWFFPPWAARRIVEGDVEAVVDQRLGSEYEREEVTRLGMVAVWCIQDDEGARPTMGMVVKMLEGVVEVAVPPPPKLLQALVSGDSFVGVVTDASIEEGSHPPSIEATNGSVTP